MSEVLKFFSNHWIIITICVAILFVLIYLLKSDFFYDLFEIISDRIFGSDDKDYNEFEERELAFSETLLKAIELDTIKTLEDVIQLYKGVYNLYSEDLSHKKNLSKLLRSFLIRMMKNDFNTRNFLDGYYYNSKSDEKKPLNINILKWKTNILDFIKENDELAPYSNLPDTERTVLIDITAFNEKDDHEAILRKVNELANILIEKNRHVKENDKYTEKLEKMNKWSVPMAVMGIVLTIFFGVLSML